jgi:hypothetical protein
MPTYLNICYIPFENIVTRSLFKPYERSSSLKPHHHRPMLLLRVLLSLPPLVLPQE